MFKWLHDFLSNRTFQVRIRRDLSENFGFDFGVPQKSILLPILLAILLSDSPNMPDVHTEMFTENLSLKKCYKYIQ